MTAYLKNILSNIFKVFTILFFVVHFLLTIIYVLPLNPIKVRIRPLLDQTIGTLFAQNWSLFAPNPVANDFILLLEPLKTNNPKEIKKHGWYDLSSPFWHRFQEHRFSAYDRLARSQSNAVRTALSGDPRLIPYLKACEKGDTAACSIYSKSLAYIRQTQVDKLTKIGSAFCNDLIESNNHYRHFALRIRIVSFPPWSKRYTGKKSIRDLDLGIHPIDRKIAPFGIFKSAEKEQ